MPHSPLSYSEISEWLLATGQKAKWLAKTIGVSASTITRWSKGDPIPESSQKLLRLLIRGEKPDGFPDHQIPSLLSFTDQEWRKIEALRTRRGFPNAQSWIVHKIRSHLAMTESIDYKAGSGAFPSLKVADDIAEYKVTPRAGNGGSAGE